MLALMKSNDGFLLRFQAFLFLIKLIALPNQAFLRQPLPFIVSIFLRQHICSLHILGTALTLSLTDSNSIYLHLATRKLPMIPLPFLAAELTRSVLLDYLHDELPRDLAVIPSTWRVLKDGSIRIEQTILVCRASQRAIVLGRKGNMIRLLREKTCKKINYYMNFPVHLFLHVKLQPSWPSDPPIRKQLGL